MTNRWQEVCKHWSLWLTGLGGALLAFFKFAAPAALWVWNMTPPQLTAGMSQDTGWKIGFTLLGLGIAAKFVNQKVAVAWIWARLKAAERWIISMAEGGCGFDQ